MEKRGRKKRSLRAVCFGRGEVAASRDCSGGWEGKGENQKLVSLGKLSQVEVFKVSAPYTAGVIL